MAAAPRDTTVQLELVREALTAVVNEMRATIIHASYSSVIYEGHDFSCALMSAEGELLAQGLDDHPLHIFAVPVSTKEVLARFAGDIHPGDVFIHNDPYTGGTHLNDILMLWPVFDSGVLVLFAAARVHWNDVGGMTPGSLSGRVSEIYQEGLRIPPTRVCAKGQMNDDVLGILFANMRVEHERRGDFNSMVGACRRAEAHVLRLIARWGCDTLVGNIVELLDRSEVRVRNLIGTLPQGTYRAEGYLESNGHTPDPLRIALALTITEREIVADFTGSSPQTAGPTNVGPSMAANAVFTVTKAFLDPGGMINGGSFRAVRLIVPEGTFINARLPAPCGGMAEVKFGIDSVVAAALGLAAPDRLSGELKGTANHVHVSGTVPGETVPFILYEWPAGGTGAMSDLDGNNVVRTYTEGDFNSIQPIEVIEARFPLRVRRSEIRADSAGPGEFRGGCGLLREIEVLNPTAALSVMSERNVIPPYGVAGGEAARPNGFVVLRRGQEISPSPIPGKVSGFPLMAGDLVRMETGGGGGYGDPLARDPQRVLDDVAAGYVTPRGAREHYGVAIGPGGLDGEATRLLRAEMTAHRQSAMPTRGPDDASGSARRAVRLSPELGRMLDARTGDIVEFVTGGSARRFWATVDDSVSGSQASMSEDSLDLLGPAAEGPVHIRALRPLVTAGVA